MTTPAPVPSVIEGSLAVSANAIAYALAKNECGEKLKLRDALIALGLEPADQKVKRLLSSDAFKLRYASYVRELKESGESFKLKARVQAEEMLKTSWEIINDKAAPHSVRMDGIKNMVEWADLNPKKKDSDRNGAPPSITINIDLGGDRPEVIDVTPTAKEIEHEGT